MLDYSMQNSSFIDKLLYSNFGAIVEKCRRHPLKILNIAKQIAYQVKCFMCK